jgi:hypothetical protein
MDPQTIPMILLLLAMLSLAHEVQINLLTEREFGEFCKNTWTGPAAPPPSALQ